MIGGADLLKFETRDLFQNDSNQTQYCELTIATAIGPWDEACAQYIMAEKAAAELTQVIAGAHKEKSNG